MTEMPSYARLSFIGAVAFLFFVKRWDTRMIAQARGWKESSVYNALNAAHELRKQQQAAS